MSNASFLPEDYVAQKTERRTNLICLTLFVVVMAAVGGAFLVTNRQWTQVRSAQQAINEQYQEAALRIDKLNTLERQKEQMLNKAELAGALVERVPRSILLAELINRMPARLNLMELELSSERLKSTPVKATEEVRATTGRMGEAKRAKTKQEAEAEQEQKKVEPPRYKVTLTMVGVAPSDLEVSRYMSELNAYPLVRDVSLDYSQEKEIEGRAMRQFKILMTLNPSADVRRIEPLVKPRNIRNPMADQVELNLRTMGSDGTVLGPTDNDGGP